MLKKFAVMICAGLAVSISAQTQPLSLAQYVKTALEHSPQSRQAASSVAGSEANRSSVLARMLPQVGAYAGINKSGRYAAGLDSGSTSGTSVSAGVGASVLVLDFGNTPLHYRAARKNVLAAQFNRQATLQGVILDARSAYFNYLLSVQLLIVNQDAQKQAQAHLEQAKVLFEVGKQAQVGVTKANVDAANAYVNVLHAENNLKLARVQLETTAGIALPDPLVLLDSLNMAEDSLSMDSAMSIALKKRPSLLAAQIAHESARLQRNAAAASFFPSVNASAGYAWQRNDGNTFYAPDWSRPGWSVGASLNVPLFEGGAIVASYRQAEADLTSAKATLDAATLSVQQEVQQNSLQEQEARQRISATGVLVGQAQQALAMSQERYKNGLAASLEITDAEVTLANARSSLFQAQYDYRVAHAKLLYAIGELRE